MQSEAKTRVFVYGTLMRGEVNHHLLAHASFVCEALTMGAYQLHDLGAFPALVAGSAGQVAGEVYLLDAASLARLDLLEGHPSFYRRTEVELHDGSRAHTYVLDAERVRGAPVIEHGQWRKQPRARRHFRVTLQQGESFNADAQDLFALLHARNVGVDQIAALELIAAPPG